jgi:hypothetical protein
MRSIEVVAESGQPDDFAALIYQLYQFIFSANDNVTREI